MVIGFRDVALDAMIEERDDLMIRLNLLEDPDLGNPGSAGEVRAELVVLQKRIARHARVLRD